METIIPNAIEVPAEFIEAVAHLRLPPHVDQHLRKLMDANTSGTLTPEKRTQLESLVEWSESLSLLRAQALHLWKDGPRNHHFSTNVFQAKVTQMNTLLQEAFAAAERLPRDEQDLLASRLFAELADEDRFDQSITQTAHKLVGMANAALAEHRTGLAGDLDEQT